MCAALGVEKDCFYEGVISEKTSNEEKCIIKYLDGASHCVDRSDIRILFRPFPVEVPKELDDEAEKWKKGHKKGMAGEFEN